MALTLSNSYRIACFHGLGREMSDSCGAICFSQQHRKESLVLGEVAGFHQGQWQYLFGTEPGALAIEASKLLGVQVLLVTPAD